MPLQDTDDFAGSFGYYGMSLEGRKIVSSNKSVGFFFAWHEMDKRVSEVVNVSPGVDIHADQQRYINSFPMMVTGHYYLGEQGKLRPHVGLGIGAYLIERRNEFGVFLTDEDTWHFGLAPEIGVAWKAGWQSAGIVSVRFNWASPGGDEEEMYINFRVGAAWM
jgi:hypothetical protein